jgi:hypothetical protein
MLNRFRYVATMTVDRERDLTVDVLVIGGGIAALYLARALHPRYAVCVVSEPGVPYECYESAGRFSAGYTGNDVARIQPARRAAGYWRLWAESNGVPHDPTPAVHVLRPEEEMTRTRVWADAGLAFGRLDAGALPAALAGGATVGRPIYGTADEVVMDPARVAAELRSGLEDRIIAAEVLRVGGVTPEGVDVVEVGLDDGAVIPVVPRFVVFASDVANAALLHKVATAIRDRSRRREAVAITRACQAVRRRPTIVARGDLPLLTAHVEGTDITALPVGGTAAGPGEVVWLVQPPVDETLTVLGAEDVRFAPAIDHKVVTEGLDRLFEVCPEVRRRAPALRWSVYVARKTEHPMVVEGDPAAVARPSPAKLETLGMDTVVAAWPSHLAYSMIVGDAVAERVQQALGPPEPGGEPVPADLPRPAPAAQQNRWQRPDGTGQDWAVFADRMGYRRG